MKKILLFTYAVAVAGFAASSQLVKVERNLASAGNTFECMKAPAKSLPSRAPRSGEGEISGMEFGYCGDPYSAYYLGDEYQKQTIHFAFEFTAEDQKPFIGSKIKSILIGTGCGPNMSANQVTRAVAFIKDDKMAVPSFKKAGTLTSEPFAWSQIDFDSSYEITGEKPLYIGYMFSAPASTCYYMPVDGDPVSLNTAMVSVTSRPTVAPGGWNNYAESYGSILIKVIIEGENLPQNLAECRGLEINPYYPIGSKITYVANIKNIGSNDINKVDINTVTTAGVDYTRSITLAEPLKPSESRKIEVLNVANPKEGIFSMTSKPVKVNGIALENARSRSAVIKCYKDGYPRNYVLEDATGTWCGWCPGAIVLLDYMKSKYPDRCIPIAVHQGDEMQVQSYMQFINDYVSGFPCVLANRMYDYTPTRSPEDSYNFGNQINEFYTSFPSYVHLDLSASCSTDDSKVNIVSDTRFVFDTDAKHLLSFVIVEDGWGPYDQQNNFYTNHIPMAGWENKESPVSTIYDDVARSIRSYPGLDVLPASIVKDQNNRYELSMPVGNSVVKGNTFRVIGMVIDKETGEIVNAAQVDVKKNNDAAVEGVYTDDANLTVSGGYGEIIVNGAECVMIYTLDGRSVDNRNLASGLYVVVADGKAFKVMVK
ncbi:MAG: hypothetical protein NC204_05220 [Candidatus Amulumruptor caecigallinarius]|nr:hypothetical protein [Candidatus Amulumruptor caecigallinarius]